MKNKIIFTLAFVLVILSLTACGNSKNESEKLTELHGIMEENYCFAVDVDDFDGDIYESGNYHFSFDIKDENNIPYYELFISDEYYDDFDYVYNASYPEVDGPWILCSPVFVGGGIPQDIQLDSGKYVYIIVHSYDKNTTTLHMNLND